MFTVRCFANVIHICYSSCYIWTVKCIQPCLFSGGMSGSSRYIPIEQFSKANQRLNKHQSGQGGGHQGMPSHLSCLHGVWRIDAVLF